MDPLTRYTEAAADHVRHPRNPGRCEDPDGEAEAVNPACGDVVRLSVRLTEGRVAAARFQAEGCPATLACASLLTERIRGLTPGEVDSLDPASLAKELGGLPEGRFHGAELACRAARDALQAWRARKEDPCPG